MKDVSEGEASLAGSSAYHWREVDGGVVELAPWGIFRPGCSVCFDGLWSSNLLEEGLRLCVCGSCCVCVCVCMSEYK